MLAKLDANRYIPTDKDEAFSQLWQIAENHRRAINDMTELLTATATTGQIIDMIKPLARDAFTYELPIVYDDEKHSLGARFKAINHNDLSGLADDDHPQYYLADGTRDITGEVRVVRPGSEDPSIITLKSTQEGFLASHVLGTVRFQGLVDDDVTNRTFAEINGWTEDDAAASFDGMLVFKVADNQTMTTFMVLRGGDDNGVEIWKPAEFSAAVTMNTTLSVVGTTTLDTALDGPLYAVDGLVTTTAALGMTEPMGFPNRTDTTLSFVDGTRTFTITGTDFIVYIGGAKYVKNTESVVIANTYGLWYIYYAANGTLTASQTPWTYGVHCHIATVYWNSANGLIGDERHGVVMDWDTHKYLHDTIGARYESGFALTVTNSASWSLALGIFHDEDIEHSIAAKTQSRIFYRNASGFTFTAATGNLFVQAASILQYNNGTALADVGAAQHMAMWMFATNDPTTPIALIMGQRVDTTIADARANNTYESLVLGTLPFREMKLLYRLIIQRNGAGVDYVEAADYRSVSNVPAGTYVATLHSALTGLSADDHPQYLLANGTRPLTASWDIGDTFYIATDTIRARDAAGLQLYDDGGNGIFVEDGGEIGIGTTTPACLIDAKRSSSTGTISFQLVNTNAVQGDGASTFNRGSINAVSGNGTVLGQYAASYESGGPYGTGIIFGAYTNHPLYLISNNAKRATITSDGLIGIGITAPDSLLHVWSATAGTVDAAAGTIATLENSDTNYLSFLTPNNKNSGIIFGDADDNDVGSIIYDHISATKKLDITVETSNIFTATASKIGVGTNAPSARLHIYSSDIGNTADYYGFKNLHTKTTGASDQDDWLVGSQSISTLNQSGGKIGYTIQAWNEFVQTAGDIGDGSNARYLRGAYNNLELNGGTVYGDVFGIFCDIDQAVAHTITGATYGIYCFGDLDGTTTGATYLAYFIAANGWDWGIYQTGATTYGNFMQEKLGIGNTADTKLHVHLATAGTVDAAAGTVITAENNDNCVLSFLTPNNKYSGLFFGDPDDNDAGRLLYDHSADALKLYTSNTLSLTLSSSQHATFVGNVVAKAFVGNGTQTVDIVASPGTTTVTPTNFAIEITNTTAHATPSITLAAGSLPANSIIVISPIDAASLGLNIVTDGDTYTLDGTYYESMMLIKTTQGWRPIRVI